MSAADETSSSATVAVWDWPIRVFHWSIVVLIGVSWWSADNREMNVHRYSGYALLGLLVFRIYWGLVGSSTARFGHFLRSPASILRYVREPATHTHAGHNPLGGLSVIVMLLLLLAQVSIGLFVTDVDGLESGPLSYLVSFDTGRALAEIHELTFNVLLGLMALHIAAILFYLFARRTNLISAMFTGRRTAVARVTAIEHASQWRIWPGIALAVLAVWLVARSA